MKITICLPNSTGFDVDLDDETIHSKYENTTRTVSLKEGDHTILIQDQAPTPSFWNSLMNLFNPLGNSAGDFSTHLDFTLEQDVEITIDIVYGDYQCVEFIPGQLFSEVIVESNDSFDC